MTDIRDTQLGMAYELLGSFISATPAQLTMITTWAAATRIFREFPAFARLDYSALEKGCGKTVALESTLALCPEPITTAYSTQSSIKNWIDEHPNSTVGLDERDLLFGTMGRSRGASAELIAILNVGYAQDGSVMSTRNQRAVNMPMYNAMAHAGIGRAYDTLADRSVTITLKRSTPDETWLSVLYGPTMRDAGADIGAWLNAASSREALRDMPRMVRDIGTERTPRDMVKLAPLAAVARLAGCYDEWLAAEREIHTGIVGSPMPTRADMLLSALSLYAGERLTADGIRQAAGADFDFAPGRIGDVVISQLMRECGIETTVSNGARGYVIPKREGVGYDR